MTSDKRVALSQLRNRLRNGTLESPTVYLALGQYVRQKVGDRRGEYGAATLEKLGAELRQEFPGVFHQRELAPILQSAIRLTNGFTQAEIQQIETRRGADGRYRLSVSHLNYVVSKCRSARERNRWINRCIDERWSARDLYSALKQQFAVESNGGRFLPSPVAAVERLESAVAAFERLLARSANSVVGTDPRTKTTANLRTRIDGCIARIKHIRQKCT
jgi:hypothetical protein